MFRQSGSSFKVETNTPMFTQSLYVSTGKNANFSDEAKTLQKGTLGRAYRKVRGIFIRVRRFLHELNIRQPIQK